MTETETKTEYKTSRTRTLKNVEIKTVTGEPWKVPAIDEEGEIVFLDPETGDREKDQRRRPKMVPAYTRDILRVVIFSIPKVIQTGNDPTRVAQFWNQVDQSDKDTIALSDKAYQWLHRLLNRPIQPDAKAKENGELAKPYKQSLFGLAASMIVNYLRVDGDAEIVDLAGDDFGD